MSADAAALAGRNALITGASSGIGRASAEALAAQGARVALMARREDRLTALAERIRGDGGEAMVCPTDVTDLPQVEQAVSTVLEAWSGLDIVVNNAGIMPVAPLKDLRVEDWTRMIDVNFKGVLHVIAAVLPPMLEAGSGHIVNVGSVAGRRPFPGGAVYAATKFAVRALTAGMQLELSAAEGIRVTDVQPGVVATELQGLNADGYVRAFESAWSDRRMLEPEDVASAIVFAVTAPPRMNVNEILVRPTDQPT